LLSGCANKLGKLFENKRDVIIAYKEEEIIKLAQYYLNNKVEREKIATNGYEKVINNHTFKQRAKHIYEAIRSL
jgi:spore maturation protein CgeB